MASIFLHTDRVLSNFQTVISHLLTLGYSPSEIVEMAKYLSTEEPIYSMPAVATLVFQGGCK